MSKYVEQSNILKKFLGKWYWFAGCVVIALAYTWYSLQLEPLVYNVSGSIMVEEDKGSSGQLPDEAVIQGLPFRNQGNLDKQIQVLKSRSLMEKVVDSLGINVLYLVERRFRDEELYKQSPIRLQSVSNMDGAIAIGNELRIKQMEGSKFALIKEEKDTLYYNYNVPFSFDGITYTIEQDTSFAPEKDIIVIRFLPRQKVATYFSSLLTFQKQAQSNILSVSMNDCTPQKLVDIINQLVVVYNVVAQENKNRIAGRSLAFIDDRLNNLSSDLFSVEGREAAFKTSAEVPTDVDASAERYIDKINTAEVDRAQINRTLSTLSNLENFLEDFGNQYEPITNLGGLEGIDLAPLISEYNKFISARERLLISATPQHPGVKKASEDLIAARSNILSGIRLAKRDLTKQEQQVVAAARPAQEKVKELPFVQKKFNEISRQVDIKNEMVLYMLQKREEAAIGLAAHVESTDILDEPVIGPKPIAPKPGQSYALAVILGLALPGSLLYLLDKMNDKVQTKNEVKAMVSTPFLGEVAYAKSERSKLITQNSRSVIAEMFRLIRTNLQFLTANVSHKTILVTSNLGGDGKTFVSGNLAACLSLTDKKTVILELDLRKPKLTELLLKRPPTVGITNYLVGEKTLEEILQPVDGYENLYLISSGPTPPNPAELLMSEKMEDLMRQLKEKYEYIVLDTPPTGLVADAFLLNKFATSSIMVARAGKTKRDELMALEEICKEGKLNHPAFILNGTKMPKRYGYYY